MMTLRLSLTCWLIEWTVKIMPKSWRTEKNLLALITSGAIVLVGDSREKELFGAEYITTVNPTFCACKELWENPCKCPESIMERFSVEVVNSHRVFYFADFEKWMIKEFGTYDTDLGNQVLSLEGVEEIGDIGYKTPYEL